MKVKQLIVFLALFGAGFGVCYWLKSDNSTPTKNSSIAVPSAAYLHLNPLIACRSFANLNPKEMRSFRSKVEDYLAQEKTIYKDLIVSYYFRDLASGQWIGIDEKELFSPASLLKIPVMIALLKKAESNPELLEMKAQYDSTLLSKIDEDAGNGFPKVHGEWYTVDELIRQMIQYSDNKSTLMLMQVAGPNFVDSVSQDLNLDIKSDLKIGDNFVRVKNFAGLFRILYNATYLNEAMSDRALGYLLNVKYKGGIRAAVPDSIAMAQKYGTRDVISASGKFTNVQLHHFALVYYPSKPFLLGVMTRGADEKGRERIIKKLTEITYSEVDRFVKRHLPDVIVQ